MSFEERNVLSEPLAKDKSDGFFSHINMPYNEAKIVKIRFLSRRHLLLALTMNRGALQWTNNSGRYAKAYCNSLCFCKQLQYFIANYRYYHKRLGISNM